jgi:MFS family permease
MVARSAERAAPAASRSTWYMSGVLFGCWVLALLDRLIISLLVPGIKQSFHASDTQVSLLYGTAFSIFYAIAGLPLGRLVDRTNRRNLLAVGLIGWSLATIACGLANSFQTLFAARICVGICQAVLAPASLSMAADFVPAERRGRTTGFLIGGATVGGALANIVGGVVLDLFAGHPPLQGPFGGTLAPWQSTLVVAGLPGLALAPLLFTLPEPLRRTVPGAAPVRIGGYLAANRGVFGPLYLAFALALMTGYGLSAWYPVIFMRNLHLPAHQVGLSLGLINLAAAAAAAFGGGYLSDRAAARELSVGRLKVLLVSLLANALALLTLARLAAPATVFLGFAAYSMLSTAATSIAYTVLPELAPPEGRGQVIAVFQFLGYVLGLGLAPTLIALVTDQVLRDEQRVNLSMMAVALPCLLLSALLVSVSIPRVRNLLRGREA